MRRAFTLVELLVVIGIVGILVAILLPVLGGVRDQANGLKCQTNLRSLGQAAGLYVQNYRCYPAGRLPLLKGPDPTKMLVETTFRPRWYEQVAREMKSKPRLGTPPIQGKNKVKLDEDAENWVIENAGFLCPSVPEWNNSRNYVFGYNYQFLGNARQSGTDPNKWINWPVQHSSIKRSAETVMAADSLGTAAGLPRSSRYPYGKAEKAIHDVGAVVNKGYLLDPPRMTSTSDYPDQAFALPQFRSGPDARHTRRTKANVLFCDGHVEAMTPQEMGYVVLSNGSIPATDPSAHNRLFSGDGTDKDPPPAR